MKQNIYHYGTMFSLNTQSEIEPIYFIITP